MDKAAVKSLKVASAWATPEQVTDFLQGMQADAEKYGFRSIVVVAETRDGSIYDGSTRTEDKFKIGAALMRMAMDLLGFEKKRT
jgi:hypothetical protein